MTMDVLEIVSESTKLLSAKLSHLFLVTVTLIFPVASITLTQVLDTGALAEKLTQHFQHVARSAHLLDSSLNRLFYLQLLQTLLSHALSFPFVLTLWLLAKTSILYVINSFHQGKQSSILGFLHVAPRLWSRLAATYLWICVMVLGFVSFVTLSPLLIVGVVDALDLPKRLVPLLEMPLVILFSVVFAHMVVVFNLAHVVSAVEERCGGAALLKALFLLKARMQPALLLFLVTMLCNAMVEYVFQYRILGRGAATSKGNWLWEAPLLILIYSFLHLFDTVSTFVLYNCCKAADWEDSELQYSLEHFSIAIEMMEQCRKMYYV